MKARIVILLLLIAGASSLLPIPDYFYELWSAYRAKGCKPILFIGNSLTFENGIPEKTQILADSLRERSADLCIFSRALPGVTLEWHWNDAQTRALLLQRPWKIVVLQEQSDRSYNDFPHMETSMHMFIEEIRRLHATPLLYEIRSNAWDEGAQSAYRSKLFQIAKQNNVKVAAVGDMWKELMDSGLGENIFEPDHHHPGSFGAFSAAMLFAECFGQDLSDPIDYAITEPPEIIADLFISRKVTFQVDQNLVSKTHNIVRHFSNQCRIASRK